MLVEAGVLEGRRLTSWPSLQTDVRNAGGEWVDEPLVVDGNLMTSRRRTTCRSSARRSSRRSSTGRPRTPPEPPHTATQPGEALTGLRPVFIQKMLTLCTS
jgi:hypothetical protein